MVYVRAISRKELNNVCMSIKSSYFRNRRKLFDNKIKFEIIVNLVN